MWPWEWRGRILRGPFSWQFRYNEVADYAEHRVGVLGWREESEPNTT
jgi:hypothetical protein